MTRRLGYLGLAFLLGQLFIFGPIEIWARNTSDLLYSGPYHLLPGLVALAVTFTAIALLINLLPPKWGERCFSAVIALSLISWVYASFLFHDSFQLSGRSSADLSSSIGVLELILWGVLIAGAVYIAPRISGMIAPLLVILLAGHSTVTAWRLIENSNKGISPVPPSATELWRHSTTENVVVILLDALQSDVAAQVLASDEGLRSAFDGFTHFRNATGVAPTTYPSIVSLHSGRVWDTERSLPEQYTTSVKEGSFFAELAIAGYGLAQVNPMKGVCAAGANVCTSTMVLMGGIFRPLLESVTLFDLSLLKIAPFQFKSAIYNNGELLVSRMLSRHSYVVGRLVEDLEFLNEFAGKASVESGPPTAKFLHLLTTHPPYILTPDCGIGLVTIAGGHLNAARCALRSVANYLEVLKRQGIYDRSMIVITADHGGMRLLRDPNGGELSNPKFAQLAASASPTLLIKKFEQRGVLDSSLEPMSITDISRIVCRETKKCREDRGPEEKYSDKPARIFQHYVWRHEYWSEDNIPDVKRFAIVGPVWEPNSWHDLTSPERLKLKLGSQIDFRTNGNSPVYLGYGWADPAPWGTWTEGPVATFRFSLEEPSSDDLPISVTSSAFLASSHTRQAVEVRANGVPVDTWQIEKAEQVERRLSIPRNLIAASDIVEISFVIANPTSPADLGLSADARKLGIGISKIVIGQR